MSAIALTDSNNLFGAMEFTKKAIKKKIQPILGANLSVEKKIKEDNTKSVCNITCLIMNQKGWQNLSILVSSIYKNLQKHKQKIVFLDEFLNHNEGLLILFDDVSDSSLIQKNSEDCSFVNNLKNVFQDRMYLNIFRKSKKLQSLKEKNLLFLSFEYNIPLVCSNDISFLNKEMYDAQDCLMCINQSTTITDIKRIKPISECFF